MIHSVTELEASALSGNPMPENLTPVAQVLWLARAGRWDQAHDACQDLPDPAGAWIHAWLHREEGDLSNASYWYHRAGKPSPPTHLSLEEEWQAIARSLLS